MIFRFIVFTTYPFRATFTKRIMNWYNKNKNKNDSQLYIHETLGECLVSRSIRETCENTCKCLIFRICRQITGLYTYVQTFIFLLYRTVPNWFFFLNIIWSLCRNKLEEYMRHFCIWIIITSTVPTSTSN